jgi:hypothetical protein
MQRGLQAAYNGRIFVHLPKELSQRRVLLGRYSRLKCLRGLCDTVYCRLRVDGAIDVHRVCFGRVAVDLLFDSRVQVFSHLHVEIEWLRCAVRHGRGERERCWAALEYDVRCYGERCGGGRGREG